jgi:hypothetical protein
MLARVIFFIVVAASATGSASIAGLVVGVACLSAHVPAATLITLTAATATATFGAVIALSAMAASLFFSTPKPPSPGGPAPTPPTA